MPIKSINFSRSHEYVNPHSGLRSWSKFGADYELEPGEDKAEARKALKEYVFESLKKQPDEIAPEPIQIKEPEPPQSTEARIIAQIYGCSDLTVLKSFELLSKNNPAIKAAYEQMEEKLKTK